MLAYVDSSALVKLAVREQESVALRLYLTGEIDVVVSRLGLIEAGRAVGRSETETSPNWEELVASLTIRELDADVAARAVGLGPFTLRTLDAIHLATALELRGELDAFVTYDARLAEAARAHRLPVVSPA